MGKFAQSQDSVEMRGGYYCKTILQGSLEFLRILQARQVTAFVLDSLLKDVGTVNSHGRWRQNLPPVQRAVIRKDLRS